jgi:general secretion pathway protein A
LSERAAVSKTRFLVELSASIQQRREVGGMTALIVDEAQSLPPALLEEVRLMANIETATEKLLPVVLVGQPELAGRLNEPALRQLKQRVALRCALTPLDLRETAAYIATRIRTAGGDSSRVFTREAVETIYERSRGIPRTISVICDNALVSGFAMDVRPVSREVVLEVCRDFDLQPQARSEPADVALAHQVLQVGRGGNGRPAHDDTAPAEAPGPAAAEMFEQVSRRRRFSFF